MTSCDSVSKIQQKENIVQKHIHMHFPQLPSYFKPYLEHYCWAKYRGHIYNTTIPEAEEMGSEFKANLE